MAQIKMDVSEYEAMKKVEKLLKESLEKERSLQEQVKKLNKEKVEALEAAKMKVVKIERIEQTEHVLVRRGYIDTIRRLFMRFPMHMGQPMIGIEDGAGVEYVIDSLFDKTTSISNLIKDEMTVVGLDDVKVELRAELEEELKEKLEIAKKRNERHGELLRQIEEMTANNTEYKDDVKILETRLEEATSNLENVEKYKSIINIIKTITQRNTPKRKLKKDLQDIIVTIHNNLEEE